MSSYLFEIRSDELPSSYIDDALRSIAKSLEKRLEGFGISDFKALYFSTPRRLGFILDNLPEKRTLKEKLLTGPSVDIALDENGNLSKSGLGFILSKKGDPGKFEKVKKGEKEFIGLRVSEGGENVGDLISSSMVEIISEISFPKSMRWGGSDFRYARPVRSIVSIFDDKEKKVTIGDVISSNKTLGHRFLSEGEITITDPSEYVDKLRSAQVEILTDKREEIVLSQMLELANCLNAKLIEDKELLRKVANLTEYPFALIGKFDSEYLSLPREVLISLMKKHQSMFALEDSEKNLINRFIGVSNNLADDGKKIVRGYERVLKARLSDAKFFYDQDRKKSLIEFAKRQDKVVYHKLLGSVADKVKRVGRLALILSDLLYPDLKDKVKFASSIYKSDLESSMVFEFPDLQGLIGREYALKEGIDKEIADAIYESYLPRFLNDEVPSGRLGLLLSLSDKFETLTGCFAVNLKPTPTQDPFGVRRLSIAIIELIRKFELKISISDIAGKALEGLEGFYERSRKASIIDEIGRFVEGRLRSRFTKDGSNADIADAVLVLGSDDILDTIRRFDAIKRISTKSDYSSLVMTFKRLANITASHEPSLVDTALFESESEINLYERLKKVSRNCFSFIKSGDYHSYLSEVVLIKSSVDRFFDDVMVMVDDIKIRNNRLNLLCMGGDLLLKVADFSRLSREIKS